MKINQRWLLKTTVTVLSLVFMTQVAAEPRFENVSRAAGMLHPKESWGAAVGDYNRDGWPDIWATNHRTKPTLYLNNRDGTFRNVINEIGWTGNPDADTHGQAWADFDRDGDLDLLELTGGISAQSPNHHNQFYINMGGALTERGRASNLDYPENRGRTPLWLDYDRDGALDVVLAGLPGSPSALFRQEAGHFVNKSDSAGFKCSKRTGFAALSDLTGDGRLDLICHDFNFPDKIYDMTTRPFRDVTALLPKTGNIQDAVFADFNGDLRSDVFMVPVGDDSNVIQASDREVHAYLAGKAKEVGFDFTSSGPLHVDITVPYLQEQQIYIGASGWHPQASSGVTRAIFSLSSDDPRVQGLKSHQAGAQPGAFIGYDAANRTWRIRLSAGKDFQRLAGVFKNDLKVTDLKNIGFKSPNGLDPRLLINTNGRFEDRTVAAGLKKPVSCDSIGTGDFDNDMDVDIFMVCGETPENVSDILYENTGNGTFRTVANAGGATGTAIGTGESVAVLDYNVDGFLDLFVTNGYNEHSIPNGPDELFRNRGNLNNWILLDLVGTQSNLHGIGARVIARAGGKSQLREQNSGMHSYVQNHPRIHFGLGVHEQVDLRVEWPSGRVSEFFNIPANQLYQVIEGRDAISKTILTRP